MRGDSEHEIVMTLIGNGVLHRFNNPAGVPYSAIYVDGVELKSAERADEGRMLLNWRRRCVLMEKEDKKK